MLGLQTVAIFHSIWNKIINIPTQQPQGLNQHDDRQHAINIIVSKDYNLLLSGQGLSEAIDCLFHASH